MESKDITHFEQIENLMTIIGKRYVNADDIERQLLRNSERDLLKHIKNLFSIHTGMAKTALEIDRIMKIELPKEQARFQREEGMFHEQASRKAYDKCARRCAELAQESSKMSISATNQLRLINYIAYEYDLPGVFDLSQDPIEVSMTLTNEYAHFSNALYKTIEWGIDHDHEPYAMLNEDHFGFSEKVSELAGKIQDDYQKLNEEEQMALRNSGFQTREKIDDIDIIVVKQLPGNPDIGEPFQGLVYTLDDESGEMSRKGLTYLGASPRGFWSKVMGYRTRSRGPFGYSFISPEPES